MGALAIEKKPDQLTLFLRGNGPWAGLYIFRAMNSRGLARMASLSTRPSAEKQTLNDPSKIYRGDVLALALAGSMPKKGKCSKSVEIETPANFHK